MTRPYGRVFAWPIAYLFCIAVCGRVLKRLLYNRCMYNDSLYRVSFKCLILDEQGRVLVVKERSRECWDIPGGGLEHGETIDDSIRRELYEEVAFQGQFEYTLLAIHNPVMLHTREVGYIKVVVLLRPSNLHFSIGDQADAVRFADPEEFRDSKHEPEHRILDYVQLI